MGKNWRTAPKNICRQTNGQLSADKRPTVSWQFSQFKLKSVGGQFVDSRLTVGQLLVTCRLSVSNMLVHFFYNIELLVQVVSAFANKSIKRTFQKRWITLLRKRSHVFHGLLMSSPKGSMVFHHASPSLYFKATMKPTAPRKTIVRLVSLLICQVRVWMTASQTYLEIWMCHCMLIDVIITIFVGLHMQHEGFTENWSWITHEGKWRTNNFYTCSKFW